MCSGPGFQNPQSRPPHTPLRMLDISSCSERTAETVHGCFLSSTDQFEHRSAFSAGSQSVGISLGTVLVLGKRCAIAPSIPRQTQPFQRRRPSMRLGPGFILSGLCPSIPHVRWCLAARLVAGKKASGFHPMRCISFPRIYRPHSSRESLQVTPEIGNDQLSRSHG